MIMGDEGKIENWKDGYRVSCYLRPPIRPPPAVEKDYEIFVKTLTNRTISVKLKPSSRIADLKIKIQKQHVRN